MLGKGSILKLGNVLLDSLDSVQRGTPPAYESGGDLHPLKINIYIPSQGPVWLTGCIRQHSSQSLLYGHELHTSVQ